MDSKMVVNPNVIYQDGIAIKTRGFKGATHTSTTLAPFIQEVWSKIAALPRYAKAVLYNTIMSGEFGWGKTKGDIFHLPILTKMTADDVSSNTVTPEANTETDRTLTVSTWKGKALAIADKEIFQTPYDMFKFYTTIIGTCLKDAVEASIAASTSSWTVAAQGTYGEPLGANTLLDAISLLDANNVPEEDRVFAIHPVTKTDLLKDAEIRNAAALGALVKRGPLLTGELTELFGVKILVSTNISRNGSSTPTTCDNLLYHKEALGIVLQQIPKMEKWARTSFVDTIAGQTLYGVEEIRYDHGGIVRSR